MKSPQRPSESWSAGLSRGLAACLVAGAALAAGGCTLLAPRADSGTLEGGRAVASAPGTADRAEYAAGVVEGRSARKDDIGPKVELSVAWVSDYVFRGVSLSDRLPAIQGSADFGLPLIGGLSGNLGLWRSLVRFDTEQEFPYGGAPSPIPTVGVRRESGIYGGLSGDLVAGWTWSAQVQSYRYAGFKRLDYEEKSLMVARAFSEVSGQPQVEISGAAFRSVFFPGADGKYLEFNLKLALVDEFTLSAHVGGSRFADQNLGGRDYVDRAITLSRPFGQYLFDLAATSTNTTQFGRLGRPILFLRASRTF